MKKFKLIEELKFSSSRLAVTPASSIGGVRPEFVAVVLKDEHTSYCALTSREAVANLIRALQETADIVWPHN